MLKLRIFSILCFTISIFIFINILYINKIDRKKQNNLIDNYVEDVKITDDSILGYIEFSDYNVKRIIKKGTSKEILDKNYVGMFDISSSLDSNNHIILAGHNVDNVFKVLHKLKIGNEVIIYTNVGTYKYYVVNKITIMANDFSYFDVQENTLSLITCTNYKNRRLLIRLVKYD